MKNIIDKTEFSDDQKDFDYLAENIPCQNPCPAKTNIPGYIESLAHSQMKSTVFIISFLAFWVESVVDLVRTTVDMANQIWETRSISVI